MLYQLPQLCASPHLVHGFSTRKTGNMSFRWGLRQQANPTAWVRESRNGLSDAKWQRSPGLTNEVRQNRQKFFKQLNVAPARVVTAELEHQDTIIRVSSKDAGSGVLDNDYQLKADGLITNEPNLYLLHVVADCLSLPYYDPQHKAVGLAHIGWRNASSGLAKKIIKRMAEEFGTNPASLIVGLGPAIHSCCYAYPKHATQQLLDWQPYLKTEDSGLTHIDLVGFVLDQLKTTGVPTANIKVSSECTAHSPQFFSHYRSQRRNKPEGRLATLIGLKPN